MKTRILIDSRAREGGDVKDFWMELRPTIENIRKVSLVWSDIPNPLQSPGGPYFLVRIPELGTRTRVVGTIRSGTEPAPPVTEPTDEPTDEPYVNPGLVDPRNPFRPPVNDVPEYDPVGRRRAAPPATVQGRSSGLETTFVVPITVNVDERVFFSPETAFAQEMNYTPPISIQRLSVNISRNYDATQITGESVLILELEHDS